MSRRTSAASDLGRLRRALLAWFAENRRRLPFRDDPDPWRVWVSEVMLQQTRVGAMLPRYRDFVARFPNPAALAAAEEDEVLAAWAGLGYYGRARALHRAARLLAAADRDVPGSAAELRELPGMGPYAAAAVASIAFGEPAAAVDGNVRRVLARVFRIAGDPRRSAFDRRVRERADALMAADGAGDPGEWNQALMELGALVCSPRRPRCGDCPLEPWCGARAEGTEQAYPERAPRSSTALVRTARAVVEDGAGRVLLVRRRQSPLRGLLDLPGGRCRPSEAPKDALVRHARERDGLELAPGRALPSFRHQIMDSKLTVFGFEARLVAPLPTRLPAGARWVAADDSSALPAGAILAKVLRRR